MGIYEDQQIHAKSVSQPIRFHDSQSDPYTNLNLTAYNNFLYYNIYQRWKSDMEIDGPTFVPKLAFLANLGQGLSQKVTFLIFEQILRPGLLDKMFAPSNRKSTFVLVSGFFGCCISKFSPNIICRRLLFY